jgi:SH3-like domain-containing protein
MNNLSFRWAVTVLSALLFLNAGAAWAEMVAISRDNVSMRTGPGMNYTVQWKLGQGFPLQLLKHSGKWLNVRDFEGASGWVPKVAVNSEGHMVVKTRKKVSLRSGPSLNNGIVAKAGYGVVFNTVEKKKGWVKVSQGGVTGWVREDLLWGF